MSLRAQFSYPQASYRVSLAVSALPSLGSSDHSMTIEFPHTSFVESPTLPPGCESQWSPSRVACTFSGQSASSIHFLNLTLVRDGSSSTHPVPAVVALVRINGENCTPKPETTSTLVSLAIRSSDQATEYDDAAHSKKYAIVGVSFAVGALILIAGCVVLRRNMTRASTVGLSRMGSLRSKNRCGKFSARAGRSSISGEYEGPDAYKHYREKSLRRQEAVREFQNMVAEKAAAAAAAAAESAGPSTAHGSWSREVDEGGELSVSAGPSQGGIENDAYFEKNTCVVDLSQLSSPSLRQNTSREPSLHAVTIPSAYLFDDEMDPGEYFKQQADRLDSEIGGAASDITDKQDHSTQRRVVWPKEAQQPSSSRSAAGSPPPPPPSSLGRRRSTRYPWAASVHRPVSIASSRSAVAAAVRSELRKAVSAEGMRVDRASMCRRCSVISQRPRRLSVRYPHRLSGHHPSQQPHHLQMHHLHQQQQQLQQLQQQEERQWQSMGPLGEPLEVHTSPRPLSPRPRPMSPQAARLGGRTERAHQRTNQHVLWVQERRGSNGLYGYI
ncbi:unnamed protein product [Mortierella alpina]